MITLYKINCPDIVVDKTKYLDNVISTTLPVNPYNDISIDRPDYILSYKPDYMYCNYIYDNILDRYYFVTSRNNGNGGRITLSCECDLLMTFKNAVYKATATVIRNENIGSTNVIDSKLPIDPQEIWYEGIDFPTQPLTDIADDTTFNYILVVRN